MFHDRMCSRNVNITYSYLSKKLKGIKPDILVILGSGLSKVLANKKPIISIPYSKIPKTPTSTVSGHDGVLDIIRYNDKIVAVMRGRFHVYEGNSPDDTVRLLRALYLCGVRTAILTNAAGSTSIKHKPGDLIILKDHINMTGLTPLASKEAEAMAPMFTDLSEPYCLKLRTKIKKIAKKLGIKTTEGVYAWMHGPQYETRSEVKMLKSLGVDVVGMSTVAEVLALRHLDVKLACISTVTNYGTGVKAGKTLSHEEVKQMGIKTSEKLNSILDHFLSAS
ncbi:MAG TPA: purine-nucleoside phosphorylase [bacterium]|nr:purine-nucleoside phosphorylase [bacterium]